MSERFIRVIQHGQTVFENHIAADDEVVVEEVEDGSNVSILNSMVAVQTLVEPVDEASGQTLPQTVELSLVPREGAPVAESEDEPAPIKDDAVVDFNSLKNSELKSLLKGMGLSVSGKKAELVARLKEAS